MRPPPDQGFQMRPPPDQWFQMRPPPDQGFQIQPPLNPASYHLYHGKRGYANEGDHYDSGRPHQFSGYQGYPEQDAGYGYQEGVEREADILEDLGEETSNLFQEAFQISSPRKKSKLSVKFARRLR